MGVTSEAIYLVGGVGVRSRRLLAGLPTVEGADPLLDLEWAEKALFDDGAASEFEVALGGGLRVHSTENALRIWAQTGLQYEYLPGETRLRIWPGTASGLSLTHGLADTAIPYVLSASGSLVLHGAGLATEAGCIAVLGETLTGKSTLTGRWIEKGGQFLSDDWLPIRACGRGYTATPSHPSVRLRDLRPELVDLSGAAGQAWSDAYAKHWLTFERGSRTYPGTPVALRAIALYRRRGDARLLQSRVLDPQEAFVGLLKNTLAFDHRPSREWPEMLERLRHAADNIPVEEVIVPSGGGGLEELIVWLRARAVREDDGP